MCPLLPAPAQIAAGGNVTIATTVAGLGPGSDGKAGRLVLGATPYDFLDLIYSATYGKWVSEIEDLGLITGNAGVSDNHTTDTRIGLFQLGVYGPCVTAGLTFQSRCIGTLTETGTGENGNVSMQVGTQANNTALASTGAFTASYGTVAVTAQNSINVGFDTGWASPGTPPTSAAYYALMMMARTSGTANAKTWTGTLFTRWVA